MRPKKILLVRDRDFFFYLHQVANLLSLAGHEVHVLYTLNGQIEPLYADLIEKTKATGVTTHIIRDSTHRIPRKIRSALYRCGFDGKRTVITPNKIAQSRRSVESCSYDWVIAYDPASLYLACTLFPRDLEKIIEYSLEVIEESHPSFQQSPLTRQFINFERKMLPRVGALMIQDRYRASLLLRHVDGFSRNRIIHYPVAVSGPPIDSNRRDYFRDQLPDRSQKRVLFFGGLWHKTFLNELKCISQKLSKTQVLIIHGGRGSVHLTAEVSPNLIVSREPVTFDQLNDLVASADIGLALYPGCDLNSKYTAFSSEKIARYTQCGLPFIAFRNEDYEFLMSETGCCELITKLEEIPMAVDKILRDYRNYRAGSYRAYECFYRLEKTSSRLLSFLGA